MYAFAACIISIAVSLGCYYAGLFQSWLNYLSYVAFIVMMVMAVNAWKNTNYNGFITYGKALGHATYGALVFSVFMSVWAFIFFEYIAHDEILKLQAVEMGKQAVIMKEKYGMSDDQIKQSLDMAKKFTTGGAIALFALIGNMFLLTIINLILAAILKKDDPSLDTFDSTSGTV
jgi:hypothetical protein